MMFHFRSKRSVSMSRICATLAILFGIVVISAVLLIVLPFRSTGFISTLRIILICVAFVFGIAWGVLSLMTIPRSLLYLLRLRRPEASVKHRLSGLVVEGLKQVVADLYSK